MDCYGGAAPPGWGSMAQLQQSGLEGQGIVNLARAYWNLSVPALVEEAVRRKEGVIAVEGPVSFRTGQHTGRSPNDKFVVREPSSEHRIWWGKVNRAISPEQFDLLHNELLEYLE